MDESTTRRIAAFDLDGTFYRWSLGMDLVEALVREGTMSPDVYDESVHEAEQAWRSRRGSYNSFMQALLASYFLRVRGLRPEQLAETATRVLERKGAYVYVFTRELLLSLQDAGYATVAISGSFTQIARTFGASWRFTEVLGTEQEVDEDGRLTGIDANSHKPFLDKAKAFETLRERHGCTGEESVGIGDTKSDASLLASVCYPIAFNPDAELAEAAAEKGYTIVAERKNVVHMTCRGIVVSPADVLPSEVARNLTDRLQAAGMHLVNAH